MKFWKPLSRFRYTDDRNEFKYHTDFSLEEGERMKVTINGRELMEERVPKGKNYKIHFEMAIEVFDNE